MPPGVMAECGNAKKFKHNDREPLGTHVSMTNEDLSIAL